GYEVPDHWLEFDEIEKLLGVFAGMGLKRLRITGGEPLLRKNLAELVSRLSAIPGINDISLSTNATQLERYARGLFQAGIKRINVSLDTLKPGRFKAIARQDSFDRVMGGLMAARNTGFNPIKINMVVMQGVNDDEIDDMVCFCMENHFILRLIEVMPMGETGRNAHYLNLQPIRARLRAQFNLMDCALPGGGPARYMQSADGRFALGFITPLSQHFCETCNRVRLSVEGTLYMCLGQNHKMEFRTMLRNGATSSDLENLIRQAIELKPERHEFLEAPDKITRIMAKTGG
ncbi:MAG: GTP 3',8-cyclase MoaA, partial [Pseudomonadota bacterium]|nr:GTP 3',8-cyclase MoaA [Pseudomonadota bacterium]